MNERSIQDHLRSVISQFNFSVLYPLFESAQLSRIKNFLNSNEFEKTHLHAKEDEASHLREIEIESEHIQKFNQLSGKIQIKHPELHNRTLTTLKASLLFARAAAIGKAYLAKSKSFFSRCTSEGESEEDQTAAVNSCYERAVSLWSNGVKGTKLGTSWPSPQGRSILDAAGEASLAAELKPLSDSALAGNRAKLRALQRFKACTLVMDGAGLDGCEAQAKALCPDGFGCELGVEVAKCETHAQEMLNRSAALSARWWALDSNAGWRDSQDLMDELSLAFQRGPCGARNSTRALDIRDRALRGVASASAARAGFASLVVSGSAAAFVLAGGVLASSRFLFPHRKDLAPQRRFWKVLAPPYRAFARPANAALIPLHGRPRPCTSPCASRRWPSPPAWP